MASPKSVPSPSPLEKNAMIVDSEKQKSDVHLKSSSFITKDSTGVRGNKAANQQEEEDFIGVLDVYIHQARDIHNICIYHKQDVYAKLCLTSHPENTVSTQIINGAGNNPVFNQNLSLNVQTAVSSLKCEIWMLSRVRNYLEDQLLGFAVVPVAEVIMQNNGKLDKEFSLSSTDLFHSPAGFVQLSLAYTGRSPDIMAIPRLQKPPSETIMDSVPCCELDKIEFPDPVLVNENQIMVSEYFELSHAAAGLESESSPTCLVSSDSHFHGIGGDDNIVETFSVANSVVSAPGQGQEQDSPSPPSSSSTGGSISPSVPTSSQSSNQQELISPLKEKKIKSDIGDSESNSNADQPHGQSVLFKPLVSVNLEMEEKVVQQDIVDMYMKSMQQFTESLAKMKLPMDHLETEPPKSGADQQSPVPKSPGSRVFYGSRAFF
ncbi:hypothetical protein Dimus_014469 [Dionaea muscipula]